MCDKGSKMMMKESRSALGAISLVLMGVLVLVAGIAGPAQAGLSFNADGTEVQVGGYLKLMMTYDLDGTHTVPYNGDLHSPYSVPMDGTPNAEVDDMRMTARESRIFLRTTTPYENHTLATYLEGDFFADINADGPIWSNGHGFRVRHAYGTIVKGKHTLLAGQTWSNFMDLPGSMPPMDFSADPGSPFVRQPQLTYKYSPAKGRYFLVSLENPTYGLAAAGPVTLVNTGASEDAMPDIVAKVFVGGKRFHISPRVVVRRFELDGQSTLGYAFALNASAKFAGSHRAVAGVLYGDGIGRYAGLGFNAGAGLNDDGEIETNTYLGVNGGVILSLRDNLRFSVGAGWCEQDDETYTSGVLTDSAVKNAFSWHSNIYWDVMPRVQYALGAMVCNAENMGGAEGDIIRLQSYLKFNF